MTKILEIKNLKFNYPNKTIFSGLNLVLEEGKITTIVGNNASGKTTLIKLICGIYDNHNSITVGYSYVDSTRIHDNSRFFGVVFSNIFNKFLFNTVYKELAFPLENLNIKKEVIEEKIIEIAKEFEITQLLDKKMEDLTSSEKQVLLLVVALIHEPKLLLIDNTLSLMDSAAFQKVINILKNRVKNQNLTVLITTTSLNEAMESDYTYIINKGNIVMEGVPKAILREEKILNKVGLELPFMIDLSLKLEFYNLLEVVETDMDRLVNALWK